MQMEQFKPKDNRVIKKGDLVGVHWNSHKNCFSIVSMKTRNTINVVLGYADNVELTDVSFKIDLSKQKLVRKTMAKDRHAFVVGEIKSFEANQTENRIHYNPFKMDDFSIMEEGDGFKKVESVKVVWLSSEKGKPVVSYAGDLIVSEKELIKIS